VGKAYRVSVEMSEYWEGWYFDEQGNFRDPAGNAYRPCDLEETWRGRQLYREMVGSQSNVRFLKVELERSKDFYRPGLRAKR